MLGHGRHQVYIYICTRKPVLVRTTWLSHITANSKVTMRSQPSLYTNVSSSDDLRLQQVISATIARQPCSWHPVIATSCCLTGRKGSASHPSLKAPKGIRSAHKNATSAPLETRTQLTGPYFVIPTSVATPPNFNLSLS